VSERRYALKGIVRGVDRDSRVVLIDHEAIPGYMGAMTMPYSVSDLKLILSLKPGDHIEATVVVADHRVARLEDIRVTQKASSGLTHRAGREMARRTMSGRQPIRERQ
jgi:Cu/Ag efflux protein CusF